MLGNDCVGRAGNREIEANPCRRREWREQGTPMRELGERRAFAERDGLRLALRSSAARTNAWFRSSTREPEQRELQGSVGEPREKQVASAEDHECESNTGMAVWPQSCPRDDHGLQGIDDSLHKRTKRLCIGFSKTTRVNQSFQLVEQCAELARGCGQVAVVEGLAGAVEL